MMTVPESRGVSGYLYLGGWDWKSSGAATAAALAHNDCLKRAYAMACINCEHSMPDTTELDMN